MWTSSKAALQWIQGSANQNNFLAHSISEVLTSKQANRSNRPKDRLLPQRASCSIRHKEKFSTKWSTHLNEMIQSLFSSRFRHLSLHLDKDGLWQICQHLKTSQLDYCTKTPRNLNKKHAAVLLPIGQTHKHNQ